MDRDTDRDWELIAAEHPFFGVLANKRYLGKTLSADLLAEFYEGGKSDVAFALEMGRRHFGISGRFRRALDFGCGVGRLTSAMAAHADAVAGVDISASMLKTATAFANASNIAYGHDVPEGRFDWLNSVIVFQHIPPARGMSIFRDLLDRLQPGAFLSIQLPFYRDARFLPNTMETIDAVSFDGDAMHVVERGAHPGGTMLMYDYPWPQVMSAMVRNGFAEMHLCHTDHGGVHGAWIFSVKR